MKNCVLFTLMILFTLSAESQEKIAEVTFEKILIDYGTIDHGVDGKRTFNFKNTGTAPLIFNRIYSSCGCTIPKKPSSPIGPGQSDEIQVKYDTNRVGPIRKTITVLSNAINSPTMSLKITGNVE